MGQKNSHKYCSIGSVRAWCIGSCWPLGGSVLSGYCLLNAIISFLFNFGILLIKAIGNKSLNICFFRGYIGEATGSSDWSWAIFCCCQLHSDKRAAESPSTRKHTDAVHRATLSCAFKQNQIIHTQIAQMVKIKTPSFIIHRLWWQNFQVWQENRTKTELFIYYIHFFPNSNIYW